MPNLEMTECCENDYFQLSQVAENAQSDHLLRLLVSISMVRDLQGFFAAAVTELAGVLDFAAADLFLLNSGSDDHWTYRHGRVSCQQDAAAFSFDPVWNPAERGNIFPLRSARQFHRSWWGNTLTAGSPLFKREMEFEYSYCIPFWHHGTPVGVLSFRINKKGGFGARATAVLYISAKILAPRFQELTKNDAPQQASPASPTTPLATGTQEQAYKVEQDIRTVSYGKLIGAGEAMRHVFAQVTEVAQAQSSVLILGETGTGKGLVAKALHEESGRRSRPFVKVNCAALPAGIIESELFGHERGSFTGAVDRRIGKFEQANNGTLFLDEIGEMPIGSQTKLLRVLQEREIERVGGTELIKVNVRIVAATNRDLLQEVHKGNFRSDLYFRLSVFPILVPPLRDRKEDIPFLAMHFLQKYVKDPATRPIGFSSRVMKQLKAHNWPGNVRELENVIQRCALSVNGEVIKALPMQLVDAGHAIPGEFLVKTIDQVEREHIISILKKCYGKVSGIGGAAEALKIPASTLTSKMRRLRIKFGFTNKG